MTQHERGARAAEHQAPGFCRRRRAGMSGLQALERTLGRLSFGTVGCDLRDLLPRLGRALEIPLAVRLDDAEVQQRLGVLRIELQRVLELRQRFVRLVRVVVADAEVGADVDVVGLELQRLGVPLDRVVVPLGVEIEVAELDARLRRSTARARPRTSAPSTCASSSTAPPGRRAAARRARPGRGRRGRRDVGLLVSR